MPRLYTSAAGNSTANRRERLDADTDASHLRVNITEGRADLTTLDSNPAADHVKHQELRICVSLRVEDSDWPLRRKSRIVISVQPTGISRIHAEQH